jgi:nitrite reductase/ring-hydroxylating ferredoxin subunit
MRKFIMILLTGVCLLSCGKGDPVPSIPVNFQSPINPKYSALNSPGGYAIVNGYGVSGLILYNSQTRGIVAYDRCSSYQPEKKCAVTIDASGFTVTDPCSGSKFSLEDGTPVKAPATKSLRSYQVITTQFTIQVVN